MSQKIAQIQDLLGQLVTKSDELTCKVDDVSKLVEDFKCAFQSLDGDVEALESIKSLVASQERDNEVEMEQNECDQEEQLQAIESALEEKKETAEDVRKFSHPCGGHGWKRVAYFDFRMDDTDCPTGLTTGFEDKPHVCLRPSANFDSCVNIFSFPVPGSYSSVCGRMAAYQFGNPQAFHDGFTDTNIINLAYLSGISLTHGGTLDGTIDHPATHIWSFAAGSTQFQGGVSTKSRCPCDGGAAPQPFVAEDYFCESANTVDPPATAIFYPGNLLWDGLGCSTCCSRIDHPYFVKHLGAATADNIDVRICNIDSGTRERVALELIELYVK